MLDVIIFGLIGAFIGWNFPQPFWAKAIQAKLVDMWKRR